MKDPRDAKDIVVNAARSAEPALQYGVTVEKRVDRLRTGRAIDFDQRFRRGIEGEERVGNN